MKRKAEVIVFEDNYFVLNTVKKKPDVIQCHFEFIKVVLKSKFYPLIF